ncbi:MAG TPA: hypothetical protein ENH00_07270 [Actinobacteria bacterium]|nr:hypothetical protein [Actinomycetota bacterium]
MGFTHLHEQVTDELRGRTFAALYTLTRTALLISITAAAFVAAILDGKLPGIFSSGIRSALVLGGVVVAFAGAITLWNMRKTFSRPHIPEEALRTFEDASDTFTEIRGRRRKERE